MTERITDEEMVRIQQVAKALGRPKLILNPDFRAYVIERRDRGKSVAETVREWEGP